MNSAFKTKTQQYLSFLESKNFCLKGLSEKCVEYYNSTHSIKVFMDSYCEINIYICKNNSQNEINLLDFVQYLKFEKKETERIKRNQCTVKTIDDFYRNVVPVLDKVVSLLLENESVFIDCNKYVDFQNKKLFLEEEKRLITKKLNDLWKAKEYTGYLLLYNKYQESVSLGEIFHKRAGYAKSKTD